MRPRNLNQESWQGRAGREGASPENVVPCVAPRQDAGSDAHPSPGDAESSSGPASLDVTKRMEPLAKDAATEVAGQVEGAQAAGHEHSSRTPGRAAEHAAEGSSSGGEIEAHASLEAWADHAERLVAQAVGADPELAAAVRAAEAGRGRSDGAAEGKKIWLDASGRPKEEEADVPRRRSLTQRAAHSAGASPAPAPGSRKRVIQDAGFDDFMQERDDAVRTKERVQKEKAASLRALSQKNMQPMARRKSNQSASASARPSTQELDAGDRSEQGRRHSAQQQADVQAQPRQRSASVELAAGARGSTAAAPSSPVPAGPPGPAAPARAAPPAPRPPAPRTSTVRASVLLAKAGRKGDAVPRVGAAAGAPGEKPAGDPRDLNTCTEAEILQAAHAIGRPRARALLRQRPFRSWSEVQDTQTMDKFAVLLLRNAGFVLGGNKSKRSSSSSRSRPQSPQPARASSAAAPPPAEPQPARANSAAAPPPAEPRPAPAAAPPPVEAVEPPAPASPRQEPPRQASVEPHQATHAPLASAPHQTPSLPVDVRPKRPRHVPAPPDSRLTPRSPATKTPAAQRRAGAPRSTPPSGPWLVEPETANKEAARADDASARQLLATLARSEQDGQAWAAECASLRREMNDMQEKAGHSREAFRRAKQGLVRHAQAAVAARKAAEERIEQLEEQLAAAKRAAREPTPGPGRSPEPPMVSALRAALRKRDDTIEEMRNKHFDATKQHKEALAAAQEEALRLRRASNTAKELAQSSSLAESSAYLLSGSVSSLGDAAVTLINESIPALLQRLQHEMMRTQSLEQENEQLRIDLARADGARRADDARRAAQTRVQAEGAAAAVSRAQEDAAAARHEATLAKAEIAAALAMAESARRDASEARAKCATTEAALQEALSNLASVKEELGRDAFEVAVLREQTFVLAGALKAHAAGSKRCQAILAEYGMA